MTISRKKIVTLGAMAVCLCLSACEKKEAVVQAPVLVAVPAPVVEFKVLNWGPQTGPSGKAFNAQPDGTAGLWIEVSAGELLGEAQVLFGGEPAKVTTVQPKLITAGIAPEALAVVGAKEVSIKQLSTGKTYPVGTFTVDVAK